MSEEIREELREIRTSIATLRETVSETARALHAHLDKQSSELSPQNQAWWITPAKVTIYTMLGFAVLAAGTKGLIDLGVLTDWRDWFTEEIR